MVYDGLLWFIMFYYDLSWLIMAYYGLLWLIMVFHGLSSSSPTNYSAAKSIFKALEIMTNIDTKGSTTIGADA